MRVKVLKKFKDRHTGEIYQAGEILDIAEARCIEILQTAPVICNMDILEKTQEVDTEDPEKGIEVAEEVMEEVTEVLEAADEEVEKKPKKTKKLSK